MKKYVLIDTNIWIYTCLASDVGQDNKVLVELKKVILNEGIELIVPEVVKLEFERKSKIEFERFIEQYKKYYSVDLPYKRHKEEITLNIKALQKAISQHFKVSKIEIEKIFKKRTTLQTSISPEVVCSCIRSSISGYKPNKTNTVDGTYNFLQPDNILIEEVAEQLKYETNYCLYIISNNFKDFADTTKGNEIIHSDIESRFKKVILYNDIFTFLHKEFGTELSREKSFYDDLAKRELEDLSYEEFTDSWKDLILDVRNNNGHLFAFLAAATIENVDNVSNTLDLSVAFEFHKERIESPQSLKIIQDSMLKIYGKVFEVRCFVRDYIPNKMGI
jgi:hypothetical protein